MARPPVESFTQITYNTKPLTKAGCLRLSETVIVSAIKERDRAFFEMKDNLLLSITGIDADVILCKYFDKSNITTQIKFRTANQANIDRRVYMLGKISEYINAGVPIKEIAKNLKVTDQVIYHYKRILKLLGEVKNGNN